MAELIGAVWHGMAGYLSDRFGWRGMVAAVTVPVGLFLIVLFVWGDMRG